MEKSEKALAALKALALSEWREIAVILIYGMAASVLSLVVPIGVQTLVNKVGFGTLNQPIVFLVFAVFVALVCAAFFRGVQIIVAERLQRRVFARVAVELAHRLPRVRAEGLPQKDLAEKANRFLDVVTIQKSASLLLLDGFTLILQAVAGLTLLAFYHPFLLAFDVLLLIAVAFILFGLGRGAVTSSVAESSAKYEVLAWLEDLSGRTLSLRSRKTREFALQRTDELLKGYLKARTEHFRIILRQVAGSLVLQAVASAVLLGIGAVLVVRNQLTLGQLVAAEIVVTLILTSFQKFQKHLESFYDLVAASSKVNDLLSLEQEREGGELWSWGAGPVRIELQGAEFCSVNSREKGKLDLVIEPGQKVAILGSNGTGKSTLADIIGGIRQPTGGTVLFDGHDVRDLVLEELRSGITLIRDPDLIEGTVADNLRFGNGISLETMQRVLQEVGLEETLRRHEQGLQLEVTETGSPLTVAQSHRLALARGLATEPHLIIIDEWLDGVDEKTIEEVFQVLSSHPATLIFCTHRADLAQRCEKTVDLGQWNLKDSA